MDSVLIKVFAFVTIIVAGYLAGHFGKIGRGTSNTLSKIVFNFTLPCAVINAFGKAEFTHDMLWLIVVGVACTVGSYFIMLPFVRKSERLDKIFYLCNISGYNIGCFALPFVQAFFPPAQAAAICLFDSGNAFMMSGGTYALTSVLVPGKEGPVEHPGRLIVRRMFSSVTIDAYLTLIVLAIFDIRIPQPIVDFTQPMANANAFLAMFMLGLMTHLSVDASKLGKVVRLLSLRFTLNVAFTLVALFVLPFSPIVKLILCMGIWAPAGAMGPVFTMWCKGDYGLAGFANTITVAVSIVALTCIALMAGVAA